MIAVCVLATRLLPAEATTPRRVATSVGMMDLIGCGFGAMPLCHGAGGLAGQYHFGARTHGSILMLGAVKLILAIGFSSPLMTVCSAFPQSFLGVMLLLAGLELTLAGAKDGLAAPQTKIVWLTTVVCLGFQQIALGFLVGCLAAWWTTLHRSPLSTVAVDHTPELFKKSYRCPLQPSETLD